MSLWVGPVSGSAYRQLLAYELVLDKFFVEQFAIFSAWGGNLYHST